MNTASLKKRKTKRVYDNGRNKRLKKNRKYKRSIKCVLTYNNYKIKKPWEN